MYKTALGVATALLVLIPSVTFAKAKDTTPPSVTSVSIKSSGANTAVARPGDTVTITFTTSEAVQTPIVLADTKPFIVRAKVGGANTWTASYIVGSKDHDGKVDYLIALADVAGNVYSCSSIKTPFQILVKYCPPTDGSSVTITHTPVPDTTAPVIGVHGDASVQTNNPSGTVVTYGTPPATDDRDGSVAVTCTPASGSLFAVGTTTVTCSATDAAGNIGHSTFKIGIYYVSPDTTAPTIAPHADIVTYLTHAADSSVAVPYTLPTATDDHDGSVPVACTPVSGSTFTSGSTTVKCTASDAANNTTQSTFVVGVYPFVPQQVTIASQSDESYLCKTDDTGAIVDGWRACYTGGSNSFSVDLGQGNGLQAGALKSVTIALAPDYASAIPANPFRISILCYSDASYMTPCSDWVTSNGIHNNSYVLEDAMQTSDNKHWTADFATVNEKNFDGSSPVVFKSVYYYRLNIQDLGAGWPAFGQNPSTATSPQPYWVISGITQ